MLETHVFGDFVPENSKYLIIGSFPVKQAVKGPNYNASYDFFYSIKRNQFWPILEAVYGLELKTKASKQKFLTDFKIAMADIILKCERTQGTNLDTNLTNFVYNLDGIKAILKNNQIEKIFFTSRFAEKQFKKVFKKFITLPSPSPRYVLITKDEKIAKYKELLPELS
jgi:hypoxanthine-DNA glycosylase